MENHILIIEDEIQITRLMELELNREGFKTTVSLNGNEGLALALTGNYSLIILDLMLPGIDGFEICKSVRKSLNTPIIMVTARDDIMDIVSGLDTGADDYLTKPFVMAELMARIRRALLRNKKDQIKSEIIIADRLTIDNRSHAVTVDKTAVELTKREYDLLYFLVTNKGSVFSREKLMQDVWGYDFFGDTNVVDVYIRYLRAKIDDIFKTKYIRTVRGVGYMFADGNTYD